jgi:hypothetical protein
MKFIHFLLCITLIAIFLCAGCSSGGDDSNSNQIANDDDDSVDDDDAGDDDAGDDDDNDDDAVEDDDDDATQCTGCEIDELCYESGLVNPENICLICDPAQSTGDWSFNDGESCDEGLACTENQCLEGLCVTTPLSDCNWPAESSGSSLNLTSIEGLLVNDFHSDLSGAVWNPVSRQLWVATNNGPSMIWVVEENGVGGFDIGSQAGTRGQWSDFEDLEGLTLADFDEPETLYLVIERLNRIREFDLSVYGTATLVNEWDTSPHMPDAGNDGAEAITFVPDEYLVRHGFVDGSGNPYESTQGMGGIMLVGHQSGGFVYAFDLNRDTGEFIFVGQYQTDRNETAGLEFDRSTGLLYIWHGANHLALEVTRLSSTLNASDRKLDTVKVYSGPAPILFGSTNYEGIAIASNEDCLLDQRDFFLTIDGGGFWSLLDFQQFPCERPIDLIIP